MNRELWKEMMSEADDKIDLDKWSHSTKLYVELLGETAMMFKGMEECAEMQQAISKCYRNAVAMKSSTYKDDPNKISAEYDDSVDNLTEEMGDVVLQIFNICTIFGIDVFDVIRAANVKVDYGNIVANEKKVK